MITFLPDQFFFGFFDQSDRSIFVIGKLHHIIFALLKFNFYRIFLYSLSLCVEVRFVLFQLLHVSLYCINRFLFNFETLQLLL